MKIEKLKKNEYKKFCDYLSKNYKKNHILLSLKIFDWQYLNGRTYNLCFKEKNEIKAIQGFIPNNRSR